ncbi:MAG TPA: metallophosphoesterase [Blastocatellia bacterium]|nr:metallophosphoesterase [Blastocatellia bacterium]
MRVFAIGDLHLEGGSGKTMDRFGENWKNHDQKIFSAWERIGREDDLLILAGDLTWATHLEEALPDLQRIGAMKGRKILIKGNHDYWWQTKAKLQRSLPHSVGVLQARSTIVNRVAVAGTRGWVCPGSFYFKDEDLKIYEREVGRLERGLNALRGCESEYDCLIVALHYPPTNESREESGFTELAMRYQATACVYGHLHGESTRSALTGLYQGTAYYLVSADYVDFRPIEIARANQVSLRPVASEDS